MNNHVLSLDSKPEEINAFLKIWKGAGGAIGQLSDGYHSFDELYDHRVTLYIKLAELAGMIGGPSGSWTVWRSKKHSDGSEWPGWFILGIDTRPGFQITYHLPESKWRKCQFAITLEKAPEFDGHTSADVLQRISKL